MAYYMIVRLKFRDAWRNLSKDDKEKWISENRKAYQDVGIKRVAEYPSLLRPNLTIINEVPSFEAWAEYLRKYGALKGKRYFEYESDLCFKQEQMHG